MLPVYVKINAAQATKRGRVLYGRPDQWASYLYRHAAIVSE